MNILNMFDGISCGRLAAIEAGIKVDTYYASEIEPTAIDISRKNFPDIVQLGDINNYKQWDLKNINLVLGGSPCQGFSRNGKGLNFEDPRSALFFKYVEVLEQIQKENPKVKFLLENVAMKKEWIAVIDEIMGVKHIEINSRLLSAQNRPRLYWTNIDFEMPQDQNIDLVSILEKVDTSKFILENGIFFDPTISESERKLVSNVNGEVRIKQATKKGYAIAENGDGINLSFPTSTTRRGRVIKRKSPTLDCQCNVCVYINGVIRRLTITELERLQTLPDHYTAGTNERLAKKAIGNGWNVKTIAHILKGLKEKEV